MGKNRKTRKEKIIADLRRKLASQKISHKNNKPTTPQISQETTLTITPLRDYAYVGKDLKKTAILSGLAILVEGVLYWWLR